MATCKPLPEGKTVFLAIYAAVVAGIIFSTLVILSSVYTSSPAAGAGAEEMENPYTERRSSRRLLFLLRRR
ncbi:hypothetical protein BHE74_00017775 [Ensete ventricosum]|uniref:Uncharacterized protein n=1 Tax=Ensete ventricosum TaxID=4639 RepID=A0A426Y5J6_ENSVE|nr:hypothetical protein B296_00016365 [Ensete ventricosum]RWV85586.1 hypothetical protein GW17_00052612 [Ensete ventricosum]RWW74293.1 hypothetical protein BHE74_00017775 [Ensete ventricosum]RZR94321.1 hypothetical protein BHM03_00022999 [Ensete ventricosum]